MKNLKLLTKLSLIHLTGLFTEYAIKKGETIGVFHSRSPRISELCRDDPYLIVFDDTDKRIMTCMFKYINHSKNPNVVIYDDSTVVALKRILPGRELVSNYGANWIREQKRLHNKIYD